MIKKMNQEHNNLSTQVKPRQFTSEIWRGVFNRFDIGKSIYVTREISIVKFENTRMNMTRP